LPKFQPIDGAPYRYDYNDIFRSIAHGKIRKLETYRELCKKDLFFLLYFGLERVDVNRPFIVQAIREVEEQSTDTLDLWAREHYKSTIISYGLPLQDLIANPEERIAFFSHTRPIAKGFLRQIKLTLEANPPLKRWFPDVFWTNPKRLSPKWSEDDGLIMKRQGNPKESSIEAWGLIDGQPTSKHFGIRIYDDVVTRESVTTPDMIKKTVEAYELSQSLGTDGGKKRVVGTHYHFADLYMVLRKKGTYKNRIKPATKNAQPDGEPVLLSPQRLAELRRDQGSYIFACQQLLNPVATGLQKFKMGWLKYYDHPPLLLNKYILGDPANEKKKDSDFTVLVVIGIDSDSNRYLLDMTRQRLNLSERWEALKTLYLKWRIIQRVGYEHYGIQADIQYFEERMRKERVYFPITPLGGVTSKPDRIERLVPIFENGQFWLPMRLPYRDPETGLEENLVRIFVDDEFMGFPFSMHDDMLDCIARSEEKDMHLTPPISMGTIMADRAETEYATLG
jgi:phage terminase large subunit-like protein